MGGSSKEPQQTPTPEIPPTPAPAPAAEPTATTPTTVQNERDSVTRSLLLKNKTGAGALRIDKNTAQPSGSGATGLNVPQG